MVNAEAARDAARAAAVPEVERARAAFAAGDAILLLTYDVSALIAMIEDVGWVLERMDPMYGSRVHRDASA